MLVRLKSKLSIIDVDEAVATLRLRGVSLYEDTAQLARGYLRRVIETFETAGPVKAEAYTWTLESLKSSDAPLSSEVVRRIRLFLFVTVLSCLATIFLFGAPVLFAEENAVTHEPVRNEKNTNGFFAEVTNFYPQGSATTVFSPEPEILTAPEIGFYKEHNDPVIAKAALEAKQSEKAEKDGKDSFDGRGKSRDEILAQYGDPKEDAALTPIENAPSPFKGLMAAMDSGDQDLAFQYARQYVRHIKNLQKRTEKVMSYTNLAMEREGMIPPQPGDKNPDRKLLEKDFENSEMEDEVLRNSGGLDPKVKAMLQDAEDAEKGSSATALTQAPQKPAIPVDPKGEVDVLFFFHLDDRQARPMAQEIEKLYRANTKNNSIHVTAFSLSKLPDGATDVFRAITVTTFPIQSGASIASKFNITGNYATVFVARNTGEFHTEQGAISLDQIKSILSSMRGGRVS